MGSAIEKVSSYVRNGKKVSGYTRKGDGPNHRADFKELTELRAEKEKREEEQGEQAQIRAILRKMQTAQNSVTPDEWSQYVEYVKRNAPADDADVGADAQ